MALQAYDVRRSHQIGGICGAEHIMTVKARDAACVHNTSHEVVHLHPILVRGTARELRVRRLTELVFVEVPEALQITTPHKTDS